MISNLWQGGGEMMEIVLELWTKEGMICHIFNNILYTITYVLGLHHSFM
jgi:hypothetical protein